MCGNGIGPLGAQHLAKGIQVNESLASVELDQNGIRAEGGEAVRAAVKENTGDHTTWW